MTKPTVGRIVHVHNRPGALEASPEAGKIAFVHSPTMINVGGIDANGTPFAATSVVFREEGSTDPVPPYTWSQFPPKF